MRHSVNSIAIVKAMAVSWLKRERPTDQMSKCYLKTTRRFATSSCLEGEEC